MKKIKIKNKINEIINSYNDNMINPQTDDNYKKAVINDVKAIVNGITNDIGGVKKMFAIMKKETNFLDFYMNSIRNSTHNEQELDYPISTVIRHFNIFWNSVEPIIEYDNAPMFGSYIDNTVIEWEKTRIWKKRYNGVSTSFPKFDVMIGEFYYDIAFSNSNDPYSQKQKHRVYLNKGESIAPHINYSFELTEENAIIKNSDNSYKRLKVTDKNVVPIVSEWADREIIDIANNIITRDLNPFTELLNIHSIKEQYDIFLNPLDEDLYERSLKIFSNMNSDTLIKNLLFLRNPHKSVQDRIYQNGITHPMQFEFWTKNRGKKLNLRTKTLILDFIKNFDALKYINTKHKKNAELNEHLYNTQTSFVDSFDQWEDAYPENVFNEGFEESKVIEVDLNGDKKLTLKELESFYLRINNIFREHKKIKGENLNLDVWNGITISPDSERKTAVERILSNNVTILKGSAGTGKSLIASTAIINILHNDPNSSIYFLAITNKAKEISNAMMQQAKEEFIPNNMDDRFESCTIDSFNSKDIEDLKDTTVIIDEVSMIGLEKFNKLLKKISDAKRIVFIGDENQLPPISELSGNDFIFKLANKKISLTLKENMRTPQKIVDNVLMPLSVGDKIKNQAQVFREFSTIDEYLDILKEVKKSNDYRVLTPHNQGLFGKNIINNQLIDTSVNETDFTIDEGMVVLRPPSNKLYYDAYTNKEFKIKSILSQGVFETDIRTRNIKQDDTDGWFTNNNGMICVDIGKMNDDEGLPISRSKALTIHSSQGSTLKNVFVIIPPGYDISKKMLYTAASRVSNELNIILHTRDLKKYLK